MAPRERDALVGSYEHLNSLPRADEALGMLKKIASVVKPIMRNRGWKVGILTEFMPPEHNLLGLNINKGERICLRLRHAREASQFMSLENVIDTMLHELSHIVIGPHNEKFNKLWDSLRDEYTDMKVKGYAGDGFLLGGQRLGGRQVPIDEVRQQARSAAEKRKVLQLGSGRKVGGRSIPFGSSIRSIIADAAQRRIDITRGCASGTQDGEDIANRGAFNGFRTQAEEDDANERAINQALWELVQEEEANKVGVAHDHQSWRTDGLTWNPATGLDISETSSAASSAPQSPAVPPIPSRSSRRNMMALDTLQIPQNTRNVPRESGKALSASPRCGLTDKAGAGTSSPSHSKPASAAPLTLNPTVFKASATPSLSTASSRTALSSNMDPSSNTESSVATKGSVDGLPMLSPAVYSGQAATLAPKTYKPPNIRSPGSTTSPVNIDISGFDDEYHGAGTHGTSVMRPAASSLPSRTWTCSKCTLCNRVEHLCCDACGAEQPTHDETPITPIDVQSDLLSEAEIAAIERQIAMREREQEFEASAAAERARLYGMAPQPEVTAPLGWSCRACGSFMENNWWTCSACGRLKDES